MSKPGEITDRLAIAGTEVRNRSANRGRRWKLLVALGGVLLVAASAAYAVARATEDHPIIISGSGDHKVYAPIPLTDAQIAALDKAAAAEGGSSLTTGDLEFCQRLIANGSDNSICTTMVLAFQNGDLIPKPGGRTMHIVAQCGEKPLPGEMPGCGATTSKDLDADFGQ